VNITKPILAALSASLILFASSAGADPEACQDAIDQFKSARSDMASDLITYASCVSDSDGHDDCSSEFSTVQSAQSDFESAVSSYGDECE
jgi:hypothetical protein